jgi:integrase
VELKGRNKGTVFKRSAQRNVQSVITLFGDKPLEDYSSSDAAALRDYLLKKGLSTSSVKWNFSSIHSIIYLCIQEHGLGCRNAFARVYIPELGDIKKRKPIPIHVIKELQSICKQTDNEHRWLIALISDTGMRLSEATGLHINDLMLEGSIPFINLVPRPWRPLKAKGSTRLKKYASALSEILMSLLLAHTSI